MNWYIPKLLAGSARPGRSLGSHAQVPRAVVDQWLGEATQAGIRSILCLLHPEDSHFGLYRGLPGDLLSYYEAAGFHVRHIPLRDYEQPSAAHLEAAHEAYVSLPKPVLVHCSAGQGRTGAVIGHILQINSTPSGGENSAD